MILPKILVEVLQVRCIGVCRDILARKSDGRAKCLNVDVGGLGKGKPGKGQDTAILSMSVSLICDHSESESQGS